MFAVTLLVLAALGWCFLAMVNPTVASVVLVVMYLRWWSGRPARDQE